jgi:hypothetical protein
MLLQVAEQHFATLLSSFLTQYSETDQQLMTICLAASGHNTGGNIDLLNSFLKMSKTYLHLLFPSS